MKDSLYMELIFYLEQVYLIDEAITSAVPIVAVSILLFSQDHERV